MMTYVQSNYNGANPATSLGVTLATNVAVGDLVVVTWRAGGAGGLTGISDNLGNTWTAQNADGLSTFGSHYTVVTSAGAMTVTLTQASGRLGVSVHHYSGNSATPADNDTTITTGTATASSTPSFTTSVADGVVVGMWGGNQTPTPEADYGGANLQGNDTGRLFTCHRLFTSTLTSETVDWTHASATYQVKAASFKTAAGGEAFPFRAQHPMAHLLVR